MVAISCKPVGFEDDKQVVEAFIVADTTPETLPTTGENIKGLNADCIFAPLSVLYVVGTADTKVYIADEKGHFVAQ